MSEQQGGETRGPWRILKSALVYDNPWISLVHHDVLTPGGSAGVYGTVAFKNVATAIVPIDREGCTWLVGQYRFPLKRYSWEIPEGGAHIGEDPLAAAQRELREETGLVATTWTKLVEIDLSNSVTDERGVAYLAEDLHLGEAQPESTEVLTVRRLPLTQVVDMVLSGEIRDSLTVTSVLAAERYLRMRLG